MDGIFARILTPLSSDGMNPIPRTRYSSGQIIATSAKTHPKLAEVSGSGTPYFKGNLGSLRILTPPMETPDPPFMTPLNGLKTGGQLDTPADIPWSLIGWVKYYSIWPDSCILN